MTENTRRQATVGVMGSGKERWEALAAPLGEALARAGVNLLTGGGQGVMASVTQAFCAVPDRAGRCIGVVPTEAIDGGRGGYAPLPGYPNAFIEIPIVSPLSRHTPDAPPDALSRNHINILSSDVVVALPGNHGTRDEIALALRFGRPVILHGDAALFADIAADVPRAASLADVMQFVQTSLAALRTAR